MKKDLVYFHTLEANGEIKNQGHVLKELPFDFLEVQLYSFVSGYPTDILIVQKTDYYGWKFYTNQEDWIKAHEKNQKVFYD